MADEKAYLRRILHESRSALSAARVQKLSAAVQTRVLRSQAYRRARAVVLYAAVDNEVRTDLILTAALESGRPVYYPRLDRSRHGLVAARVTQECELRPDAWGIPAPAASAALDPSELGGAVVCVPGLGFSPAGQRLGRGGGHYDRMLARLDPSAVTVGLAYGFQLLEVMPERPHDRRLDFIITESTVHAVGVGSAAAWDWSPEGGVPKCNG